MRIYISNSQSEIEAEATFDALKTREQKASGWETGLLAGSFITASFATINLNIEGPRLLTGLSIVGTLVSLPAAGVFNIKRHILASAARYYAGHIKEEYSQRGLIAPEWAVEAIRKSNKNDG